MMSEKIKVWDGDQKRLFQKNAKVREEYMLEIKQALEEKLKQEAKL